MCAMLQICSKTKDSRNILIHRELSLELLRNILDKIIYEDVGEISERIYL